MKLIFDHNYSPFSLALVTSLSFSYCWCINQPEATASRVPKEQRGNCTVLWQRQRKKQCQRKTKKKTKKDKGRVGEELSGCTLCETRKNKGSTPRRTGIFWGNYLGLIIFYFQLSSLFLERTTPYKRPMVESRWRPSKMILWSCVIPHWMKQRVRLLIPMCWTNKVGRLITHSVGVEKRCQDQSWRKSSSSPTTLPFSTLTRIVKSLSDKSEVYSREV